MEKSSNNFFKLTLSVPNTMNDKLISRFSFKTHLHRVVKGVPDNKLRLYFGHYDRSQLKLYKKSYLWRDNASQ